jgi:hypothetical protein
MNTTNYTTTAGNTYEIFHDYAYSTNINWDLDFDTLQEVQDYCEAYDKAQTYGTMLVQLGAVAFDYAGNIIDLLDRLPEVQYIYAPNKAAITMFGAWTEALIKCYKLGKSTLCLEYCGDGALFAYSEGTDSFQEADSHLSALIYSLLNR